MRHDDYASSWIIHCGNKADMRSATENNQSPDYGCPMFSHYNNQQSSMWRVLTLLLWMVVTYKVAFLLEHDIRVHFTAFHYSWNQEKWIKIPSIPGLLTVYGLWRFYCHGPSWRLLHWFPCRNPFNRHQHLTHEAKAGQWSWAFQKKITVHF